MGLLNLRNALMAGKRLPYDAEVEYLESTGTQWIDTGYAPKANSGVRVSFRVANVGSNDGIFGARTSGGNDRFWIVPSSVGMNFGFGGPFSLSAISANTDYTASLNFMSDGKATCGASSTNISGFSGCPYPLYIFAANVSGTASFMEYRKRIYGLTITEGSEVVHDFIPVRVGTTGYLYDRVSGKLFGNAGTGDFVLGPDVVPVEYIESHGTEWIDLGAVVSPDTDFQFKGTIVSDNTNGCAFGESARFSWAANNPAYSLALATGGGYAYLRYGDSSANAIGFTKVGLNTPFTASLVGQDFSINGLKVATVSRINSFSSTVQTMSLFKRNNTDTNSTYSIIKIESLNFGNKFHLRPVRVGTEGAMMDVLTRRIYRNAGTGAFTYGNDLRYPIPAE